MTDMVTWWGNEYESQYYAFPNGGQVGSMPSAGLVDLNIFSKKPDFLSNLSSSELIPLTQSEWLSLNLTNLVIKNGVLSNYVAPPVVIPLATQAATLLKTQQSYVMQNYAIYGEDTPAEWLTYLKALRAIANGTDTTSTTLPAQPTATDTGTSSTTTASATS